jgi:hypothetical protein
MSNENSNLFANWRTEINEQGFVADEFLAADPDCPVFGLNLACAYPFPAAIGAAYTTLAKRLAALDDGIYAYPVWETHVTIMTFVNFNLHRRPSPERLAELRSCIGPILQALRPLFDGHEMAPFRLEFLPPVLTRKAAILPMANPSGEILQIRRRASQLLRGNRELHEKLLCAGLNVPEIIHSTIMRLKTAPRDLPRFEAGFDAIAATTSPFATTVGEILLTTETKPYMREGEILHRFALTDPVMRRSETTIPL